MEILYRDENLIVCIKEVGIDSEHEMVSLIQKITDSEVYVVHRLDLNVSGVMVYALNKATAAYLNKLISNNELKKEYVAIVTGIIEEKQGTYEDLLFKDSRKKKSYVVKRERKGVKKASLDYDVIGYDQNHTIVHILLHTGRTHQIRVQFSSRKHPLLGDHKYGARDQYKVPMLYSCALTFPYHNETVRFKSYPEWSKQK